MISHTHTRRLGCARQAPLVMRRDHALAPSRGVLQQEATRKDAAMDPECGLRTTTNWHGSMEFSLSIGGTSMNLVSASVGRNKYVITGIPDPVPHLGVYAQWLTHLRPTALRHGLTFHALPASLNSALISSLSRCNPPNLPPLSIQIGGNYIQPHSSPTVSAAVAIRRTALGVGGGRLKPGAGGRVIIVGPGDDHA